MMMVIVKLTRCQDGMQWSVWRSHCYDIIWRGKSFKTPLPGLTDRQLLCQSSACTVSQRNLAQSRVIPVWRFLISHLFGIPQIRYLQDKDFCSQNQTTNKQKPTTNQQQTATATTATATSHNSKRKQKEANELSQENEHTNKLLH